MWPYLALAAYQLYSGAQQAETIRDNADFSRQIAELNAKYAEIDAFKMEQQGEEAAARYRAVIDATLGTQRVAMAAQGIDLNFGTAAALQAETKLNGFLNQLDIKNQAHAKALGYKTEARNTRLQAQMGGIQAESEAASTQRAALFGAVGTTLSGYGRRSSSPKTPSDTSSGSFVGSGASGGFYGSNYLGAGHNFSGE